MQLVSLAEFKQTSSSKSYRLLEACAVFDNTYHVVAHGIYVYWAALTGALLGGPVYAKVESSAFAGTVSQDYDLSGVLGSGQGLVGAHAPATAALCAAAGYGWVQTLGPNVVALTTDGDVTAGQLLAGTSTNGTWGGVAITTDVAATAGTAYNAGHHGIGGFSWIADSSASKIAAYGAWLNSVFAHSVFL